MKIAVLSSDSQWREITSPAGQAKYCRISCIEELQADTAACLFLHGEQVYKGGISIIPVMINSVYFTLKETDAPPNMIRINGWPGFLSRPVWEVSGPLTDQAQTIFAAMGKRMLPVPDEPGFVSARVIAMIINEAYFALEDGVSSREEIDTAMKLGTGYPYGPFEWATLIGVDKIAALLQKLSLGDKRYLPAPLLKEAANK